ncbi:MAG: ImmA/IrrE family metallo-endopeptidase [Planctomycetes bacterium]|nr:ImmA/IrrE family metallo-endopeptidase [Planctomycetota bacterium]
MIVASRKDLVRSAIVEALRVRREADFRLCDAVCPFDLAERNGIEVRFQALASFDGMRSGDFDGSTIVISSLRPPGRKAFTCAHELGHEVFDHGVQFDELVECREAQRKNEPEEMIADAFAGFLLMPKSAVEHGLAVRGLPIASCGPREIYALASWLGVGYTTLIWHLQCGLRLLGATRANELRKVRLSRIRKEFLGYDCPGELVIVDSHWRGRPVDIQVDDLALMPAGGRAEGTCIEAAPDATGRVLVRGVTPGIGRLILEESGWSSFIRVSRRDYVGRNKYRHLEETDDE